VKTRDGVRVDEALRTTIRNHVRRELSPRHVPAFIFETPEIPMTVNGKKTEIPVKKLVCGQSVTPSSTVANPHALRWYERFAHLDAEGVGRAGAKL